MVPLFYKENLLGIVALGNKFTGEAYQSLDKKILENSKKIMMNNINVVW